MLAYAWALIFCFFSVITVSAEASQPSIPQTDAVRLVSPQEGAEIVGKKPEIRIEFPVAVDLSTLAVILDSTDVTQVGTATASGFSYVPVLALPPGQHTLIIMVAGTDGTLHQKTVSFSSKHGAVFDEAGSNNEISAVYEAVLSKPDDADSVPYSRIEANLKSDSKLKRGPYEASFSTNLRYFDQNLPVGASVPSGSGTASGQLDQGQFPITKGISLVNYLLTGRYVKDQVKLTAEVGDVQVTETQNTVSGLARRGGKLNLELGQFTAGTFLVKGERISGFRGGLGIEGSTADHIFGASAGAKLLDGKVEVKGVYVTGGEPGNSAGISTSGGSSGSGASTPTGGNSRGDVIGLQIVTDFFENRLRTEMEADYTRFDPDSSDEYGKTGDQAYRAKLSGALGQYAYEARYEYYGRDYAVIGNQGALRDTQLALAMGNAAFDGQNINMVLMRTNDNVDGDELFPRVVRYDGMLTYSYTKLPQVPIMLSYLKSLQESKHEPPGTGEIDINVDTLTASIAYVPGSFSVTLMSSWSIMNDRTSTNADTTNILTSLSPVYATQNLSIAPMLAWNRTKDHLSSVWTDTYTASMNLGSRFYDGRLAFDTGVTFTAVRADNDMVDTDDLNLNARLGYNLKHLVKGLADPWIALRSTYRQHRDDNNHDADSDEFILFLVLSATMPFSF